MKTYQAPWGGALIVISSLLVVLSIASVVGLPMLLPNVPEGMASLAPWLLPVIVLCCLPFMIRGYVITEDAILIRRLFWTTRLDCAGLKSVDSVPNAMRRSLRTFGNGGGFSVTGWYWSKSLGFYRAFVTDLNRTVVLRFANRTVVVSPDDPEGFVNELKR
ncbi:MAG TPA: PH domain-containing protein [Luteolibacter sp.]|nr:PH domain-containing protein [Luteolibacter sp.]